MDEMEEMGQDVQIGRTNGLTLSADRQGNYARQYESLRALEDTF